MILNKGWWEEPINHDSAESKQAVGAQISCVDYLLSDGIVIHQACLQIPCT